MRRERIILAVVAIFAGLILASSVFYFDQNKNKTNNDTPISPTVSLSNGKTTLEIESPQDLSITDKKLVDVKGKAQTRALIVLTTNSDDFVFEAGDDGSFQKTVTLEENENLLTITAYPENDASETKELTVTYTTEEF